MLFDYDVLSKAIEDKFEFELEEFVNGDEDDVTDVCEQIDSYNGFLDDDRYYPMNEIDEFVNIEGKSVLEVFDMFAGDFDSNDDYFQFGIYGISSTNSRDYVSLIGATEIIEQIKDNINNVDNDDLSVIFDNEDCASSELDDLEELFADIEEDDEEAMKDAQSQLEDFINNYGLKEYLDIEE